MRLRIVQPGIAKSYIERVEAVSEFDHIDKIGRINMSVVSEI